MATVPIAAASVRRFSLMREDSVTLVFSLPKAVHFAIGDYIDDELFGRFVVASWQMPSYNKATGGFDYSLVLDAPYMRWRNTLFMLTTTISGNLARKETDWSLTDRLEVHLQEVARNLETLAERFAGKPYTISVTAEKASEVRHIQYTGVDIITALGIMAEAWECEWWVRDGVIHMGKCEDAEGEPLELEIGKNVESMDIVRNQNTYYNKVYVFGSSRNIPRSYRKSLIFEVTDAKSVGGMPIYSDAARPVSPTLLLPVSADAHLDPGVSCQVDSHGMENAVTFYSALFIGDGENGGESLLLSDGLKALLTVASSETYRGGFMVSVAVSLEPGGIELTSVKKVFQSRAYETIVSLPVNFSKSVRLEKDVEYRIRTDVRVYLYDPCQSLMDIGGRLVRLDGEIGIARRGNTMCLLRVEGDPSVSYMVRVNPLDQERYRLYYDYFGFVGDTPPGFGVGSRYTLEGLDETMIPESYYTDKHDDPSALSKVGERRLRMPEGTGDCLTATGVTDAAQAVEGVAIFDDEYPRAMQRVASVRAKSETAEVKHQDGSSSVWAWTSYALMAELADGVPFEFKSRYINDNTSLQVKFVTKEDLVAAGYTPAVGAGYRLAGMTFGVAYDEDFGEYTLVRNEDYGTMLPNDTLRPEPGDPFVLLNWNVKAMGHLGLVGIAERRLLAKGREYIEAMEQSQYTFTVTMMSDEPFRLTDLQLVTVPSECFTDSGALYFRLRNDYSVYRLPVEGARVRIVHGALKKPKLSRVIGYELKLDKPYDHPRYTIGETDAYSRLKRIEKEITKTGK